MSDEKKYKDVYDRLFKAYGPQEWWPADSDMEMVLGAILVQNTAWRNVERALKNLDDFTPAYLKGLSLEQLKQKIRPSGFYNQKAERIQSFLKWFEGYNYDFSQLEPVPDLTLRKILLSIHGIGPETADCMMVYVFKRPFFIIDAYTRRIFQ